MPAIMAVSFVRQLIIWAPTYCPRNTALLLAVLSGSAAEARRWGADGAYGSPRIIGPGAALTRLVTVHSLAELRRARRADAVLLSPVFPTRSHPGAAGLLRAQGRARVDAAGAAPFGDSNPGA